MRINYLLSTAAFLLFTIFTTQAQTVVEGVEDFSRKEKGNALSITVEGQTKNVLAVMDQLFKDGTGNRAKNKAGLRMMEGARYGEISGNNLDYYYKVSKPSRGDKIHSKVTLFMSSGNNNFMSSTEFPDEIAAAKEMLEGLQLHVRIYEMELLIDEQGKLIEKEEKKYDNLQRDSVKLENIILEAQANLEQNRQDQSDQRSKIKSEQDRLEAFRIQLDELKNKRRDGQLMTDEDEELLDAVDEKEVGDDDGGI